MMINDNNMIQPIQADADTPSPTLVMSDVIARLRNCLKEAIDMVSVNELGTFVPRCNCERQFDEWTKTLIETDEIMKKQGIIYKEGV